MTGRFGRGLVIGKFDPFHRGHSHLISTAESRCDCVTAIVCGKREDSVPAELRAAWIRAAHPAARVLVVDDDALGLADDDSEGWARATVALLGASPDAVFTSEDYGAAYASFLGCEHVSVDPERTTVPVSGTAIRGDPLEHLAFLDAPVRAHYVLRVCLLGAESSGKTTLAAALADAFHTVWTPEFGHHYQALGRDDPNGPWTSAEFLHIARLQHWLEDFQAGLANRVVFCDTDVFTTAMWHEALVGTPAPEELVRLAEERTYGLFIVCDTDIPFRQDVYELREDTPRRVWMQERYLRRAEESQAPWLLVSGPLDERVRAASQAVERLLTAAAPA
jgi:HTH-type transcriptional repressor of NAD biosynthesis genes